MTQAARFFEEGKSCEEAVPQDVYDMLLRICGRQHNTLLLQHYFSEMFSVQRFGMHAVTPCSPPLTVCPSTRLVPAHVARSSAAAGQRSLPQGPCCQWQHPDSKLTRRYR